jgi:hypothetical protein
MGTLTNTAFCKVIFHASLLKQALARFEEGAIVMHHVRRQQIEICTARPTVERVIFRIV